VPGWNKIPKLGRMGIGMFGFGGIIGKVDSKVSNMVERLVGKVDGEFAQKVLSKAENGFITFYKGIINPEWYPKILKNGFNISSDGIFVTTDSSEALSYAKRVFQDNDLVVKMKVPIELVVKALEKGFFRDGSHGEEINVISKGIEILNQFIKR
jgi:hypothetical protein